MTSPRRECEKRLFGGFSKAEHEEAAGMSLELMRPVRSLPMTKTRCEMERWQPIETAPKDTGNKIEYILICEGNCVPDLVVWHGSRKPRVKPHDDGKAWVSDIPEGWFNVSGSRSRIMNPTHWMPLPAPPQIRGGGEK